jgi:polysaccharide export outer membrane protein
MMNSLKSSPSSSTRSRADVFAHGLSRAVRVSLLIGLVAAIVGCAVAPKIKPDVVGTGDLSSTPASADRMGYPDAVTELALLAPGKMRPSYRVGPLDEIVVMVWGRTDLGSQTPVGQRGELRASQVRSDGTIGLPFLGDVKVAGMTVAEIRAKIGAAYRAIVEEPQVDVTLNDCGSQTVQLGGAVAHPGTHYLCVERLTVGEVLTDAKALTGAADRSNGVLTRGGQSYRLDYRQAEEGKSRAADIVLHAGDTVFFPATGERMVYVFGEVEQQGSFAIPTEGMTILDALGQAQGVTPKAGAIFLTRPTRGGPVTHKLKLAELLQGPEIQLVAGDRIYVAWIGLGGF